MSLIQRLRYLLRIDSIKNDFYLLNLWRASFEASVSRSKEIRDGACITDAEREVLVCGHYGWKPSLGDLHAEFQVMKVAAQLYSPERLRGSFLFVSRDDKKTRKLTYKEFSTCKQCYNLAKSINVVKIVHYTNEKMDISEDSLENYFRIS